MCIRDRVDFVEVCWTCYLFCYVLCVPKICHHLSNNVESEYFLIILCMESGLVKIYTPPQWNSCLRPWYTHHSLSRNRPKTIFHCITSHVIMLASGKRTWSNGMDTVYPTSSKSVSCGVDYVPLIKVNRQGGNRDWMRPAYSTRFGPFVLRPIYLFSLQCIFRPGQC